MLSPFQNWWSSMTVQQKQLTVHGAIWALTSNKAVLVSPAQIKQGLAGKHQVPVAVLKAAASNAATLLEHASLGYMTKGFFRKSPYPTNAAEVPVFCNLLHWLHVSEVPEDLHKAMRKHGR
eukprot:5697904-Prorocentrum_lima.AAC.1